MEHVVRDGGVEPTLGTRCAPGCVCAETDALPGTPAHWRESAPLLAEHGGAGDKAGAGQGAGAPRPGAASARKASRPGTEPSPFSGSELSQDESAGGGAAVSQQGEGWGASLLGGVWGPVGFPFSGLDLGAGRVATAGEFSEVTWQRSPGHVLHPGVFC